MLSHIKRPRANVGFGRVNPFQPSTSPLLKGEVRRFLANGGFSQYREGEEPFVGVDRESVFTFEFDLPEEQGVPNSSKRHRAHSFGEKALVLERLYATNDEV